LATPDKAPKKVIHKTLSTGSYPQFVGARAYREPMKRVVDVMAVAAFSVAALLAFHLIPEVGSNDDLNGILNYSVIALAFFYYTHTYKLPSLKYFRLPELTVPSVFALIVVSFLSYAKITGDNIITLPLIPTISGIAYLFSIGVGEELVSRGFGLGVLKKYGMTFAVVVSSVIFGLMHLNRYLGEDWDPVNAYWHCLSASGFGFLAAAVMIATRSILAAIVLHALTDWTVVFVKPVKSQSGDYVQHFDPLWQTIKDSFAFIFPNIFFGLCVLAVYRLAQIRKVPRFIQPLLLKFKLIE
jgi:membrane protease YdiL (CAAX protease family)